MDIFRPRHALIGPYPAEGPQSYHTSDEILEFSEGPNGRPGTELGEYRIAITHSCYTVRPRVLN